MGRTTNELAFLFAAGEMDPTDDLNHSRLRLEAKYEGNDYVRAIRGARQMRHRAFDPGWASAMSGTGRRERGDQITDPSDYALKGERENGVPRGWFARQRG